MSDATAGKPAASAGHRKTEPSTPVGSWYARALSLLRAGHIATDLDLKASGGGRFVRSTRCRMQLTQKQLARRLGIKQDRLARIERGVADLRLSEFFDLCLLMGTWGCASSGKKRPKDG